MDFSMKLSMTTLFALFAAFALSSCSDPDYAEMCVTSATKKISKKIEISITDKMIVKQGLSATVTLKLTGVLKEKTGDDTVAYYKASCIIKGDRVTRSFLRPATG